MDSTPDRTGAPHFPDAAPPVVPGYDTERLLGRGGSSSVWLIRSASGEPFALKVIDPAADMHFDPDAFGREERFHTRFHHDHLLAVHEVVPTDQGPALRMDYAAGGSLLHLVSVRGPLPPGEVVTVLTPMAQVLAYLHAQGAAHGDVSPGNIVFTELGKPLLADFGIGRLLGEGRHAMGGTPGFHEGSPDPHRLNTEADIYALAAVGWFALTGRVPGPAMQRPPLSLLVPDTPAELTDLINGGLDGDPAARPGAHEFARAVQRTAQAEPLDLVAAVHPEVLPKLRTRRSAPRDAVTGPGRRRRRRPRPLRGHRLGRHQSGARDDRVRRRESHRWGTRGTRIRVAGVAGLAVAGLALIGLTMSGVLGFMPVLLSGGPDTVTNPTAATLPDSAPPDPPTPDPPPTEPDPSPVAPVPTQPGGRTIAGVPDAALAGTDPLAVLPYLSKVREHAFETADPALLRLVNVEGSPAMATDQEAVAELARRGHILAGLTIKLTDLAPTRATEAASTPETAVGEESATAAAVTATSTTSGYTEVPADGALSDNVQRSVSLPIVQQLVFVLELEDDGWRISTIHEP
ncbi:serine/threonine-protein kinase [Arthrobacter sp. CAN_A1]|uniref:serine/threonine-protein kinase n=1 Tax=Arthrobacter sp. CAN_A1 TaxID=2787717 RepID=UPI0018CA8083